MSTDNDGHRRIVRGPTMFEKTLPPAYRDRLLDHPRMKPKLTLLNLVSAAFLLPPLLYLAILASGLLPSISGGDEKSFPLWWILVGIAMVQVPVMFVIGTVLFGQAKKAPSFEQAFSQGQSALIVVLSFAEMVSIYGLVSPLLNAPVSIAYALTGFGLGLVTLGLLVFRKKLLDIVLLKLSEEESEN